MSPLSVRSAIEWLLIAPAASSSGTLGSFRLLVVVAQAATIAITWPLWQVREMPPNLPLIPLSQVNLGWWLLGSLMIVLVRPVAGLVLHGALLVLAMLLDQTRIQPQLISQVLLLVGTLPAEDARMIARVHLISLWFYAALHKFFSPDYWNDIVPWLWSELVPADSGAIMMLIGGVAAGVELSLALLAILPRTRRVAAVGGAVFHLAVLAALLHRPWNPSVWPWNLALAAAGFALISSWPTTLWSDMRASRFIVRAAVWLMFTAPLGYYFGLVDPYFAHCLYAGNTPRAFLHSPSATVQELRYLPELNVFLPPAHRIYEEYYATTAKPGDALEIQDRRLWAARQGWDRRMITRGGEYRRGLRHGPWIIWSEDGRKEAEGTYLRDQMEGHWTFYYEDGRRVTAEFHAGKRVEQP